MRTDILALLALAAPALAARKVTHRVFNVASKDVSELYSAAQNALPKCAYDEFKATFKDVNLDEACSELKKMVSGNYAKGDLPKMDEWASNAMTCDEETVAVLVNKEEEIINKIADACPASSRNGVFRAAGDPCSTFASNVNAVVADFPQCAQKAFAEDFGGRETNLCADLGAGGTIATNPDFLKFAATAATECSLTDLTTLENNESAIGEALIKACDGFDVKACPIIDTPVATGVAGGDAPQTPDFPAPTATGVSGGDAPQTPDFPAPTGTG
ncbi:hypothetical protein HK101_003874, partial [Irineochytrium annulatum]